MQLDHLINHLQTIQKEHGNIDVLLFDSNKMSNVEDLEDKHRVAFYFPFIKDIRVVNIGSLTGESKNALMFVDKKTMRQNRIYNKDKYRNLIGQMT